MPEPDGDFDVLELSRLFEAYPDFPPVTKAFQDRRTPGADLRSQREHMVTWFRAQSTHGSGEYTRARENRSARRTYNRLLSPEGLIWIAEVMSVEPHVLGAAVAAAQAEPEYRRRCAAIRRVIPWEVVFPLIQAALDRRPSRVAQLPSALPRSTAKRKPSSLSSSLRTRAHRRRSR